MDQCLGIAVGQLGWEWSPVAGERDEARGGVHETIHSVDSASNDECRSAVVKMSWQMFMISFRFQCSGEVHQYLGPA